MIQNRYFRPVLVLLLMSLAPALWAKSMYIDDTFYATLRSGKGTQYQIKKSLKSGTPVEVLQTDDASGYSQVQTQDGTQGWLLTRYLTPEPIAADRLVKVSAELDKARTSVQDLRKQLKQMSDDKDKLAQQNKALNTKLKDVSQQLDHIRTVSQDALNLDKRNRQLQETNQKLHNQVEVLAAENDRLKGKRESNYMMIGGGLVILGVLIAVIIPWLKPSRKTDSWV